MKLTPVELEIAEFIADGLSYKEIARRTKRSHRTIAKTVYRIDAKLDDDRQIAPYRRVQYWALLNLRVKVP